MGNDEMKTVECLNVGSCGLENEKEEGKHGARYIAPDITYCPACDVLTDFNSMTMFLGIYRWMSDIRAESEILRKHKQV